MALITASNLSKSFGAHDVFRNLALSIPHQARIALVGPNGIGKTTLLRILAGEDSVYGGEVHRARSLRIGYLPQETSAAREAPMHLDTLHSLWEECLRAFEDLRLREVKLADFERLMAEKAQDGEDISEVLDKYGNLQAEFEHNGGYTYQTRIRQVLTGLGFSEDDHAMPLPKLSGGQRTRAVLARLLLSNPELLVMDEPTNHLDIAAVEWLEGHFNQWKGAALIVSHDRYFLDKVCNIVWEMQLTNLELYHSNYSAYVQQRQERWELRQQQFAAEKERLEKEMAYIKRNIAGQNVTQARGKLRRVSRIVEAVEQLGFEGMQGKSWSQISPSVQISVSMMSPDEAAHRIQALRGPSNRPPQMKLNLRSRQRSGNIVLRTEDLRIGYGSTNADWKPLCAVPDLELRRLECAALIGPNGSGKTTFLKTILGLVLPLEGEVLMGASLQVGYFTQGHEDLVAERTLMQEIDSIAPQLLPADVRNHLARYLFTGDDVFKQVSTLSGGERGRLALAKLALMETNLLLLDEPTNHLDIPSQEILQSVLDEYQGTIILVTHDRYLVDRLATQIWEIIPAEAASSGKVDAAWGNMRVFQGTYSQYRLQQEQAARETLNGNGVLADKEQEREAEFREKSRLKNRSQAETRRRAHRISELEHQIAEHESQIKVLSRRLENPPTDIAEVHCLGKQYMCLQDELNALLAEWEKIHGN